MASNNTTFKLQDVKDLFKEGLNQITADHWHNYDNHVQKVEQQMWEKEDLIDELHGSLVHPVVIYNDQDDSDYDSDTDNEE